MKIERRRHPTPQPPAVSPTWLPAHVLDRTVDLLLQSGTLDDPHEGVVYWAGRRVGGECFVTTCIAPAAETTFGSFETSSQTNARVVMYLANAGLELVGQVHSHPSDLVGHSDGDDERALMPYLGFLSIVVPDYARRGMHPLTICGVHVFGRSGFRRLATADVEKYFYIVDDVADLR